MIWQLSTATAVATPGPGFWDAGFGRFLISPGFGGLAALLGAALVYLASRQKAAEDREDQRQQRWWEALTWIYDRATAEREEARLDGSLALDLFERLAEEAHTDLEVQAALGLTELFDDQTEAT